MFPKSFPSVQEVIHAAPPESVLFPRVMTALILHSPPWFTVKCWVARLQVLGSSLSQSKTHIEMSLFLYNGLCDTKMTTWWKPSMALEYFNLCNQSLLFFLSSLTKPSTHTHTQPNTHACCLFNFLFMKHIPGGDCLIQCSSRRLQNKRVIRVIQTLLWGWGRERIRTKSRIGYTKW